MITPDHEADLKWYFSEARGACGVRSSLGPQLDILRAGTMCGRNERVPVSDLTERVIMAAERANAIGRRLRRVPRAHVVTLRVQYEADEAATECQVGESRMVDGMRVALIVSTPTALRAYDAVTKRAAHKSPTAAPPTRVMWLAWLCKRAKEKGGAQEAEALDLLLTSARGLLDAAHDAYEGAKA